MLMQWFEVESVAYLAAWKRARVALSRGGRVRMSRTGDALDAEAFARIMRRDLDDRINARGGVAPVGRKLGTDYQASLARDCWAVRAHATTRLRVHRLETPDVRRRFAHIECGFADD